MTRSVTIACVVAACLLPGVASAQAPLPAAPPPPPGWMPPAAYAPYSYGTIPIELDVTEPNVAVQVFRPGADVGREAPIAQCSGACVVNLVPGRYKIWVTESGDTLPGGRELELKRPTRVTMDPDMQEHRTAGLVLGITGPIMLIAGMVALVSQTCIDCEHPKNNDTAEALGVFGIVGGLVATPVGWVMYGTSFKPEYELQPLTVSGYGGVPASVAGRSRSAPGLHWTMRF